MSTFFFGAIALGLPTSISLLFFEKDRLHLLVPLVPYLAAMEEGGEAAVVPVVVVFLNILPIIFSIFSSVCLIFYLWKMILSVKNTKYIAIAVYM